METAVILAVRSIQALAVVRSRVRHLWIYKIRVLVGLARFGNLRATRLGCQKRYLCEQSIQLFHTLEIIAHRSSLIVIKDQT